MKMWSPYFGKCIHFLHEEIHQKEKKKKHTHNLKELPTAVEKIKRFQVVY